MGSRMIRIVTICKPRWWKLPAREYRHSDFLIGWCAMQSFTLVRAETPERGRDGDPTKARQTPWILTTVGRGTVRVLSYCTAR